MHFKPFTVSWPPTIKNREAYPTNPADNLTETSSSLRDIQYVNLPSPHAASGRAASKGENVLDNKTIPKNIGDVPRFLLVAAPKLRLSPDSGRPCTGSGSGVAKSFDQSWRCCCCPPPWRREPALWVHPKAGLLSFVLVDPNAAGVVSSLSPSEYDALLSRRFVDCVAPPPRTAVERKVEGDP